MNYFAATALVNAFTAVGLGTLIYLKSNREKLRLVFVLFCTAWAFWSFSYFFWQIANSALEALTWSRSLMRGSIFIPTTFLHFVLIFTDQIKRQKIILMIAYLQSLFFLVFSWSIYYISHVEPVSIFSFWPKPGILYHPFLVIWISIVIYCLVLLFLYYKNSNGLIRQQTKYIIIGTIIGFAGGCTNYFLWYDISIIPYLNFSSAVYVTIIAYAILRYRLFGIKIILNKIFIYIITIFLSATFFYLFYLLQNQFFNLHPFILVLITAIIFSLIFTPLYRLSKKLSNQIFYSGYNPYDNVDEIINKLKEFSDLNNFSQALIEELEKALNISKLDLLFFLDEEFINIKSVNNKRYERDILNRLIAFFNIYKIAIIKDEVKRLIKDQNFQNDQLEIFNKTDSHIIIPIYYQSNLIATLFLGKRNKKQIYNQEDIIFLEKISIGISAPLQHVKINYILDSYVN